MAPVYGYTAKLGFGATATADEQYEFLRDGLVSTETIADLSAIRGTRSRPKERTRVTQKVTAGQIVMNPTPLELSRLLPRILGAAASGTTFALAETLPEFYVVADRTLKVLTYDGCKVGKATFKAAVGSPLELTLDIVGKDEAVGAAGTFPALTLDILAPPFILADLAIVIGGTTFACDTWECVVDNVLEVRFGNSLVATAINPTDRIIAMNTRVPYGDAATLYASGSAGVAVTATFTNGTVSALFTFPALQFPKSSPVVDSRGEEWLNVNGVSRKSGSTNELVVTLDSTV